LGDKLSYRLFAEALLDTVLRPDEKEEEEEEEGEEGGKTYLKRPGLPGDWKPGGGP